MSNTTTHVTTFYSFKGGVGRTLLLANVGARLATIGRRVLLWDLDMEAPGLHRIPRLTPDPQPKNGFMEWLLEWQKSGGIPDDRLLKRLYSSIRPVPKIGGLDILPAHGEKADFAGIYTGIDWRGFLVDRPEVGLKLFRMLLREISDHGRYDHILLDARTGVTDLGGLLAAVLPHATVLVGTYGAQNLAGLLAIYKALEPARTGRLPQRGEKPNLRCYLALSPIPTDQDRLRAERKGYLTKEMRLADSEIGAEIPFDSRLLFREELFAIEEPDTDLGRAYIKVADEIEQFRTDFLAHHRDQQLAEQRRYAEQAGLKPSPKEPEVAVPMRDKIAEVLRLLGYRVEKDLLVDGEVVELVARKREGFRDICYLVACSKQRKPVPENELARLVKRLEGTQARDMQASGMFVAQSYAKTALDYAAEHGILALTLADLDRELIDFDPYLAKQRRAFETGTLGELYVDQQARLASDPYGGETTGILHYALRWARGEGQSLLLVTGDSGSGTTTFCQRLAYELSTLHRADPEAPVPVLVSLKEHPQATNLDGVLEEHFQRRIGWHGNPEVLIHLLDQGRILLLLDGFHELAGAHTAARGAELLRALVWPTLRPGEPRGNRVLLTSRNHLFAATEPGEVPSSVRNTPAGANLPPLRKIGDDYGAAVAELLPLSEEATRSHLEGQLGVEWAQKALALLKRPELAELAGRPFLLGIIAASYRRLGTSEHPISPARIYREYADLWLNAKTSTRILTPDQLRRATEVLAAKLWHDTQPAIHYQVLLKALATSKRPSFRPSDLDRLDPYLRTASFLVRTEDGHYTFTYRSFQEFFLACHLLYSAKESPQILGDALDAPLLSPESVEFLAQLAEDEGGETVTDAIRSLLAQDYRPRTSEHALRFSYAFAKQCAGDIGPELTRRMQDILPEAPRLGGARLESARLPFAFLEKASLRGAKLHGACLDNVHAAGADLSGATLVEVSAQKAVFSGTRFEEADLSGADFRDAKCDQAFFNDARCYVTRFAGADLRGTHWSNTDLTRCTAPHAQVDKDFPGRTGLPGRAYPFLQLGHSDSVDFAVFHPRFDLHHYPLVLTASRDHTARLWDVTTGEELQRFEGHTGWVWTAVFHPELPRVLTTSSDHTVRLWDIATGEVIGNPLKIRGEDDSRMGTAFFSADGRYIATAAEKHRGANIWNAANYEHDRWLDHKDFVLFATFDSSGRYVLTTSTDGKAYLWKLGTPPSIKMTFEGHKDQVHSGDVHADRGLVVTASNDGTAQVWRIDTGEVLTCFQGHSSRVRTALFHPREPWVLTAGERTARLWNLEDGEEIRRIEGHTDQICSASLSHDGRFIITASQDGTARVWDIEGQAMARLAGSGNRVLAASFDPHPDHPRILVACGDGTARMIDRGTGQQLGKPLECQGEWLYSATFGQDERRVVTASADHTAAIFNADTCEKIAHFRGHLGAVRSAVFNADGRRILTASHDGTARLWDAATGREIRVFKGGHGGRVLNAVFDPTGQRVLTCADDPTVRLWEIESGMQLRQFGENEHKGSVYFAIFDPSGQQILTTSADGLACLWDVGSAILIRGFPHPALVRSAAFHPQRPWILTACDDGTARLWDKGNGRLEKEFKRRERRGGHWGNVRTAVFDPADGDQILTASDEGTVRLWDTESGKILWTFAPIRNGWVTLYPDGDFASGDDGSSCLSYYDPKEREVLKTLWKAEDLPERRKMPANS